MRLDDWFLTAAERGNRATRLDDGRGNGMAWSTGNEVRPLIHGAAYFAELHRLIFDPDGRPRSLRRSNSF